MHLLLTAVMVMALGMMTPARAQDSSTASQQASAQDVPAPLVMVIGPSQGTLGREVRSKADEHLGRIVDVVVDRTGRARAAVVDFGGFLGVGSRKIAVDWNALHFGMVKGKEQITLDLTKDQVKAAPEFHEGKPIVVLGALSAADEFGARLGTNTGKPNAPPPTPSTPER